MITRELMVKRLCDFTLETNHILQEINDGKLNQKAYFEFDSSNKYCTVYNYKNNSFRAMYPLTHFYFEVIENIKK
jgi:hypothetical protein